MKQSVKFLIIVQLSAICIFGFMSSCQQQESNIQEVAAENYKAILDKNLEVWNSGNLALIDELYSPEFTRYHYADSTEIKGIDAMKAYVTSTRTAYPDFIVKSDELIISDNIMIVRWTSAGTNTGPRTDASGELPPTGNKVKFSGVSICKIVDDKLTEELVYMDLAGVLGQLGYTITPP